MFDIRLIFKTFIKIIAYPIYTVFSGFLPAFWL